MEEAIQAQGAGEESLEAFFRQDYQEKHPEAAIGFSRDKEFPSIVQDILSREQRTYKKSVRNVFSGLTYGEVEYPRTSKNAPKGPWNQIERSFEKIFGHKDGLETVKQIYVNVTTKFARECDTAFHDLGHIIETAICAGQIYCGLEKSKQTEQGFKNAVVAGILHDMGYLKGLLEDDNEPEGSTGAFYTKTHVARTMGWAEKYLEEYFGDSVSEADRKEIIAAIKYTDLSFKETDPNFMLGQVMMGADLISQMGAQDYVQKTAYLHDEFIEGGISADLSQKTVQDLWKGTAGFAKFVANPRIEQGLEALDNYFGRRNVNPYRANIEKNLLIIAELGEGAAENDAA